MKTMPPWCIEGVCELGGGASDWVPRFQSAGLASRGVRFSTPRRGAVRRGAPRSLNTVPTAPKMQAVPTCRMPLASRTVAHGSILGNRYDVRMGPAC